MALKHQMTIVILKRENNLHNKPAVTVNQAVLSLLLNAQAKARAPAMFSRIEWQIK